MVSQETNEGIKMKCSVSLWPPRSKHQDVIRYLSDRRQCLYQDCGAGELSGQEADLFPQKREGRKKVNEQRS